MTEIDGQTLDGEVEIDGSYYGGHIRPANLKEDRIDRRLSEHQTGTRRVVVALRERGGRTLPFVTMHEARRRRDRQAHRVPPGEGLCRRSRHWDALHDGWTVGRINHSEAYSQDGANTNQVESYFSRLRRMVDGQHHRVCAKYLYQYANEAAWKEDHRRLSNGTAAHRTLGLALHHPVSRNWAGYWQRPRTKRGFAFRHRPGAAWAGFLGPYDGAEFEWMYGRAIDLRALLIPLCGPLFSGGSAMPFIQKFVAPTLLALALSTSADAADRWMEIPEPPAMPEATESGTASVNGIDMYYATYGEGEPVLLIHGGLGHADIWANQVADLMTDHRVIVADSRGHGRSSRDDQPFGYDLMAEDYVALLDHLGIEKTALVGWSDGGIIGLDIAMKHPERLTRLFAHAANSTVDGLTPTVGTDPVFGAYIEKMGAEYARLSPTPDQYDAFLEQIGQMWASEPAWTTEELEKIAVPTAIVLGDHDEAITLEHTEYLAATIPGAELIILPDVSHFAMLQDPAGYTKAVRDFIDAK